ncbi:hypothetical protein DDZ13_13645 [Coraliomargarita sinensis]|uniref:Uncharacterized protein n=1 Tax=Coraliomargarita sinensis TaxID=2174842 RepID=A0A317ZD65_9BACT|nr:hypothetical protein DDZ13_13645 [Coraliomargarita sinensis]
MFVIDVPRSIMRNLDNAFVVGIGNVTIEDISQEACIADFFDKPMACEIKRVNSYLWQVLDIRRMSEVPWAVGGYNQVDAPVGLLAGYIG